MGPGLIVNKQGVVLGKHRGIHHFTVGQRKGLGVAASERLYVIQTDKRNRRVVVGQNRDLFRSDLIATKVNWISIKKWTEPIRVKAQIRNRHQAADATLLSEDGKSIFVRFDEPQRAITPGQAVAFYQDDLVVGGGWIQKDC